MAIKPDDPRFLAMVDLLPRIGARSFQIRYEDDEQPTVWIAVALFNEAGTKAEAAAAVDPVEAMRRLCEQLVDGGTCQHCGKGTAFELDFDEVTFAGSLLCWYQYDPERKTIRRGCEGA